MINDIDKSQQKKHTNTQISQVISVNWNAADQLIKGSQSSEVG